MTALDSESQGERAFLVTGASGWLGRATLEVLSDWLGPGDFDNLVDARSSVAREIRLSGGRTVHSRPIGLPPIHSRYILVSLAFLTRDHSQTMAAGDYLRHNLRLVDRALELSEGASGVVLISSGAVLNADGTTDWDASNNPYGFLKNAEEAAVRAVGRGRFPTTVCRLWGAAGPDVTHPHKYAFSDFVLQALSAGRITVHSPHAVWRRYSDARQLMELCLRLNMQGRDLTFDSGGPLVELRDLATRIAREVGPNVEVRSTQPKGAPDRRYSTSDAMESLLSQQGMRPLPLEEMVTQSVKRFRRSRDGVAS